MEEDGGRGPKRVGVTVGVDEGKPNVVVEVRGAFIGGREAADWERRVGCPDKV